MLIIKLSVLFGTIGASTAGARWAYYEMLELAEHVAGRADALFFAVCLALLVAFANALIAVALFEKELMR